jgi:3',5'-cyclic AMP phosphodiesterase CpdA
MAYGDGTFVEFETRMFQVYRDMLHRVPSWPTMGNHEFKTDSGQPYLDVYYLPEQAWRDEEQERYYSFDQGNVHFISLDSNEARLIPIALDLTDSVDDDMLDWAADDLAASDADWKIAIFHHPPYSSSSRSPNGLVREQILPVLEEGGVDLVLVGHDHHYERTIPLRGGCAATDDSSGITYVVAGAGGAGLRGDVADEWWAVRSNDTKHSFFRMTIQGCELRGEAVDIDGEVIDEIVMSGCD